MIIEQSETVPDDGAAIARSIGMYIASETVAIRERTEGAIRLLTYAQRLSNIGPGGVPTIDALALAQRAASEASKHARYWLDAQVVGLRSPVDVTNEIHGLQTCTSCGHGLGLTDE